MNIESNETVLAVGGIAELAAGNAAQYVTMSAPH